MPRRKALRGKETALRDKEIALRQKPGSSGSFHKKPTEVPSLWRTLQKRMLPAPGDWAWSRSREGWMQPGMVLPARKVPSSFGDGSKWCLRVHEFHLFCLCLGTCPPPLPCFCCHSPLTLLSDSLPRMPHPAAWAVFLRADPSTPVSRSKPFTAVPSPLPDKAQDLTWTHSKVCLSNIRYHFPLNQNVA